MMRVPAGDGGAEKAAVPPAASKDEGEGKPRRARKTFEERLQELTAFQAEHGHLNLKWDKDKSLYRFCVNIRRARRGTGSNSNGGLMKVTKERIAALDNLGFVWVPKRQRPGLKPQNSNKRRVPPAASKDEGDSSGEPSGARARGIARSHREEKKSSGGTPSATAPLPPATLPIVIYNREPFGAEVESETTGDGRRLARIVNVVAGSQAETAGLRAGDLPVSDGGRLLYDVFLQMVKGGVRPFTFQVCRSVDRPKHPLTAFNLFYRFKRQQVLDASTSGQPTKEDVEALVARPPGLEGADDAETENLSDEQLQELRRANIRAALEDNLAPRDTRDRRHRQTTAGVSGPLSFVELGKLMNAAWMECDEFAKTVFGELADEGREVYHQKMREYHAASRQYDFMEYGKAIEEEESEEERPKKKARKPRGSSASQASASAPKDEGDSSGEPSGARARGIARTHREEAAPASVAGPQSDAKLREYEAPVVHARAPHCAPVEADELMSTTQTMTAAAPSDGTSNARANPVATTTATASNESSAASGVATGNGLNPAETTATTAHRVMDQIPSNVEMPPAVEAPQPEAAGPASPPTPPLVHHHIDQTPLGPVCLKCKEKVAGTRGLFCVTDQTLRLHWRRKKCHTSYRPIARVLAGQLDSQLVEIHERIATTAYNSVDAMVSGELPPQTTNRRTSFCSRCGFVGKQCKVKKHVSSGRNRCQERHIFLQRIVDGTFRIPSSAEDAEEGLNSDAAGGDASPGTWQQSSSPRSSKRINELAKENNELREKNHELREKISALRQEGTTDS
ncbi:hypothetical protein ACHAXT_010925 [Thalassiosira profunda]